jgi:predicted tellurium resistance membrane protein TerC
MIRRGLSIALLAAIAMLPWLWIAATARIQLRSLWLVGGTAWIGQLWLVAGASAIARGRSLAAAAQNLARALVPWLVTVAAIALGFAALVVPGVLLLVLLAPLGASERLAEPLPAPLHDAFAIARRNPRRLALVIAAIVIADVAIAGAGVLVLAHVVHQPRVVVRAVALAVSVVAPGAAWLVARSYTPKP